MNTFQIIVTDDETGKKVAYSFEHYQQLLAKFSEIKRGYVIIQEHTVARLTVQRKKDLFS